MPSPSELQRRDEAANAADDRPQAPNCFVTGRAAELDSRCTCTNCRWWRRKHEEGRPLLYRYACDCPGVRHDGITAAYCPRHGQPIAACGVTLPAVPPRAVPALFRSGAFTLHSGAKTTWKIDCDALSDADLATLAAMAAERLPPFGAVEGVPTGGLRFAEALKAHATAGPLLIAEDVVTTGASMERHRAGRSAVGVAIFARGKCPEWVVPLFVDESLCESNDALRFTIRSLRSAFCPRCRELERAAAYVPPSVEELDQYQGSND